MDRPTPESQTSFAANSRHQQLTHHFSSIPMMVAATCGGAGYCVWALWDAVPTTPLAIGYAMLVVLSLARVAQHLAYRRATREQQMHAAWYYSAIAGAATSGVLWGTACILFYPTVTEDYQGFLLIMITLVPMAAIGTSAICLPVFYAYYVPSLLPLAAVLAASLERPGVMSAGLLIMLGGAIAGFAHRYSHRWNETLRLTLELEASLEMKSRVIAYASHDLRQPAGAMRMYIGSLAKVMAAAGKANEHRKLAIQIQMIDELLGSVWDMTCFERQQKVTDVSNFRIDKLAEEVSEAFSMLAEDRKLQLQTDTPPITVRSSRPLVMRILSNLILNALTFTPKGHVTIRCVQEGDVARLVVSDTGIGIEESARKSVFKPYVQLLPGMPAAAKTRGQGLGLSICEMIAAHLGHPLSVRANVHGGTDFQLELPTIAANATLETPDETVKLSTG